MAKRPGWYMRLRTLTRENPRSRKVALLELFAEVVLVGVVALAGLLVLLLEHCLR